MTVPADALIRAELLRVKQMPPWGRVQSDEWDRASRFIYSIHTLEVLRLTTKRVAAERGLPLREFGGYVIRRWYNFHTHQVALGIILAHPHVRPERDPLHHTVDFYLDGAGFDLKLTPLPGGFGRDIGYARAHPEELIRWLYANQTKEGRFHVANRLFIVFHDAVCPDAEWELRRDFAALEQVINAFLDAPRLTPVEVADLTGDTRRPLSGVIFCVREAGEAQEDKGTKI